MGRAKKGHKPKAKPVYDSDDERTYEDEEIPDKQSDSYYNDDVDEFHAEREKILLSKGASLEPAGFSSDEEEVLGFESEEDDEELEELSRKVKRFQHAEVAEDMASDLEDNIDDDLPDDKAWGNKKNKYYGADVTGDERIDFEGSDTEAAVLEEKEALALQRRMADELDEGDFGLDLFKAMKKPEEAEDDIITQDLSSLSKKEQLQLLKKESPELLDLIEEYKAKMTEIHTRILPLRRLVQSGQMPAGKGADYLQTKLRLYLNYCINISFYLMLKANRSPVQNHPVISRLVQHRNLIKQLEVVDEKLRPEMDLILQKLKNGEEIRPAVPVLSEEADAKKLKLKNRLRRMGVVGKMASAEKKKLSALIEDDDEQSDEDSVSPSGGRTHGRKKKKLDDQYETKDEKEALEYYDMLKAGRHKQNAAEMDIDEDEADFAAEEADEAEDEEGGKRGITYQIEKNKGLTPHRKKEQRNPRVKHRMKYRKAKIGRKGQIREARTEMHRYGGELSGIRAGVIKGVKLRN